MWCRKQPAQGIHHKDGNPLNNRHSNLVYLCGACHNKVRDGQISRRQLLRRLGRKGIKKVSKKQTQRKKRRTPLERVTEKLKRDFALVSRSENPSNLFKSSLFSFLTLHSARSKKPEHPARASKSSKNLHRKTERIPPVFLDLVSS